MINNYSQTNWRVEPFVPSGTVRGVKRKGPETKFKPIRSKEKPKTKTAVLLRGRPRMTWTDEKRSQLVELKESGLKWGEIADKLGTTREAVRREYRRCLESSRKKI